MAKQSNNKDISYKVKDMPQETNEFLNKLCTLRGIMKHELVREALMEYAVNHRNDPAKILGLV